MTDLKELQQLFQRAVMGGAPEFLSQIEDSGRLSPERQLGIYQHAYKSRLRGVMEEDFPVLHSMLGDDFFHELCNDYIDAYPSTHPSLRYFGQHLEKFISGKPPYNSQEIIIEMARFEWMFHDVFDAPDQDPVTVEDVMALSPDIWTTLRFTFHPSLNMTAYDWNVAAVWLSVQEEGDDPTMPERIPETSQVIQWRHNLRSYFRTLSGDEAQAFSLALAGRAFPDICESLIAEHGDQAPVRAAELLKNWVVEGLITSLDYLKVCP